MTYPTPAEVAAAVADSGARVLEPRKIADGFSWPEIPRSREGVFYFSDMYNSVIKTIDAQGNATVVIDATGRRAGTDVPIVLGGFDWLPDGRLLVVSTHEHLLLVHNGGGPDDLVPYADISEHCLAAANDMVIDGDGRAYVTQLGFNIFVGEAPVPSPVIVVEPDGSSHTADKVGPLMCANGITISADGSKVYTAEVMANRLTVIDRDADGALSNPREFAACPFMPDGIGLDVDGGVWAAMPGSGYVARFTEDGMTDAVPIPLTNGTASACMLGGSDRSTLYMTVGVEVFDFEKSAREAQGSIWTVETSRRGGDTRP